MNAVGMKTAAIRTAISLALLGSTLSSVAYAQRSVRPAARGAQPFRPMKPPLPNAGPQGPELVQRLVAMSPEDREKALSALPPARRQNLEQRIRDFEALPPGQQLLMRTRVEKLAKLSPERQDEVRESLRSFNAMPQERRQAIRREVIRCTGMPEDSYHAYLNSEGMRGRFTDEERRMIDDLLAVAPDEPPTRPRPPQ